MGIMGIGPLLAIVGAICALVVVFFIKVVGLSITLPAPWREWVFAAGVLFIAIGVSFWIASALNIRRAYGAHRLATTGVYGVSRNPMYAGFIVFLIPGLALLLNEMLILFVPVAMFLAFKLRIGLEEEYLGKVRKTSSNC
jgi:protein-S-isoprenylcysteine O-methyltransferase Ste14